jgi:hypothetical protein
MSQRLISHNQQLKLRSRLHRGALNRAKCWPSKGKGYEELTEHDGLERLGWPPTLERASHPSAKPSATPPAI